MKKAKETGLIVEKLETLETLQSAPALEDTEDAASESDGSDGHPEDAATDEEEAVASAAREPWHPPMKLKDYVTKSEWATDAATMSVRVISASHLPKRSGGGGDGAFDGSGGADDSASLEVELLGAPCDAKKWPVSAACVNDGVKHIFDLAVAFDVAEPRLALLRFTVLRQGMPCAQTVVPVHRMRKGVRWTQLYDPLSYSDKVTADYLLTRLLVMVHIEPFGDVANKRSRLAQVGRKAGKLLGKLGKGATKKAMKARTSLLATGAGGFMQPRASFLTSSVGPPPEEDELTRCFREAAAKDLKVPPLLTAVPAKSALKKSKYGD
jgi:hypothetical protein